MTLPYSIWGRTTVLYKHVNVSFEMLMNDFFIRPRVRTEGTEPQKLDRLHRHSEAEEWYD